MEDTDEVTDDIVVFSVRFPRELYERLRREGARDERPVAYLLRQAAKQYLEREEKLGRD
jgi:predicted DNA-binding protein